MSRARCFLRWLVETQSKTDMHSAECVQSSRRKPKKRRRTPLPSRSLRYPRRRRRMRRTEPRSAWCLSPRTQVLRAPARGAVAPPGGASTAQQKRSHHQGWLLSAPAPFRAASRSGADLLAHSGTTREGGEPARPRLSASEMMRLRPRRTGSPPISFSVFARVRRDDSSARGESGESIASLLAAGDFGESSGRGLSARGALPVFPLPYGCFMESAQRFGDSKDVFVTSVAVRSLGFPSRQDVDLYPRSALTGIGKKAGSARIPGPGLGAAQPARSPCVANSPCVDGFSAE